MFVILSWNVYFGFRLVNFDLQLQRFFDSFKTEGLKPDGVAPKGTFGDVWRDNQEGSAGI